MTIVIPKPVLFDKVLRLFGKKRGVAVNGETAEPTGIQTYYAPKKESALKALFRPSGRMLPKGMTDIFMLQCEEEIPENNTGLQSWTPFAPAEITLQDSPPNSLRLL